MAGVLIRMKLAVLRHSLRGQRLEQLGWGVAFGIAGVIGMFLLGKDTATLTVLFGLTAMGWALGPVLFTGEDKTLQPEHFRSLPVSPFKLATGLLAASFAGLPALMTAIAFTALVFVSKSPLAIPAILLQLAFVVILSRVITGALRRFVQSPLAAMLSSLVTGAVMAFFITGWVLLDPQRHSFSLEDLSPGLFRALPSGWAVVAVEAAQNGDWLLASGALAGLAALIVALLAVWAVLLRQRLITRPARSGVRARATATVPGTPLQSVLRKELLTWRRDYTRASFTYFAFFFSVFVCAYPAMVGIYGLLPFIGGMFAVTAAGSTANLYGLDGSALWLTLTRPDASRADVRGRQLAWLLLIGPIALLATVVPVALTGQWAQLPLALGITAAAVGAGAGLLVLHSVYRLMPMTDPHKRGDDMFDHEMNWLQFVIVFIGVAACAATALIGWPLAILTGAVAYWGLGWLAAQRLRSHGAELLQLMLHGRPKQHVSVSVAQGKTDLPAQFYVTMMVGVVALFPQGVVPAIFKLTGVPDKVWFLALHLPGPWQWPVIAAMVLLGLTFLGWSWRIYRQTRRRSGSGGR